MKNLLNFKVPRARMLLTILCLLVVGVGQMWAMNVKKPKVYFNNQTPNWSTSNLYFAVGNSSFTRLYYTTTVSNTKLQYVDVGNYSCTYCSCDCQQWSDATYVAFCRTTSAWDQSGSYAYSNISSNAEKYSGSKGSYNMDAGNTYYCYMANANNGAALTVDYISGGYGSIQTYNATQSAKKRDTGTTYSTVSGSWPATLKLKGTYLSGDGASTQSTITSTASTDGDAKKVYGAVVTGEIIHSYESLSSSYYFEGWGTGDSPSETGSTCTYNISADRTTYAFFSKVYTLSYDRKGTYGTSTLGTPTIANFSGTKTSGSSIPTGHTITFTASPATGYEVEGWYSDAACSAAYSSGSGGVTISADKNTFTLASLNANSGVYCKFRKKTYSITLDDNGDYQGDGSATVQRGDDALTVSSHASRTGWNLVGYWTASGVGGSQVTDAAGNLIASVSGFTDGSGNWIKDDNVSLYAHWNQINSLSVVAGSNISSVTGSTSPVTLNTKYAISATPNTGYSFSGWTASPSDNGVFDDASAASTNVTVKNGSVTVTGAATENKSTVTVTANETSWGSLQFASTSKSWGTTASVGVTTTQSITATPSSGKVFHEWILSGGAASSSTLTNTTITLAGDGSGDAGTATADFGVASGWYMMGDAFGGWNNPTTSQLTYPYRGMSGVYYIPVASLPTDKYWRVYTGSKQYNTSSSISSDNTISKGTIYTLSENSTKASKPSSALSDVWIVVNTGSSKKLWVQDPQTFHNVNVTNEGSGSKGTYKVTLKTTSAFTKGSNVFETTQYANGETFTVTVTGVDGYIPTITIGGNTTTFWKQAASYSADGTMSTSDIAVSITYTASYAVTFAQTTGGGTLTATGPSTTISTGDKVKSGTSITFTQTPTHSGYDFSSWNSASTGDGSDLGGNASGLTKSITEATTVYPIYTVHTFTGGTLDKKEGSLDGSYSVTYLATTMTPSAPTRTGYNVSGYYKETGRSTLIADASGNLQKSAGSYTDASNRWTYTSSIPTLYTGWTAKTYSVTLDDNGSYQGNGSATATYDGSLAVSSHASRTGYDVEGYYKEAGMTNKITDGSGVLQASTFYTDASSHWTKDTANTVNLYAKWTAHTYTITLNHGVNGSGSGTATVDYDDTSCKSWSDDISQTGYHVSGWYDNSTSRKVLNADHSFAAENVTDFITSGKWSKAADCELQAWWDPDNYNITLDVDEENQGNIEGATTSHTVTFNTLTTAIPNLPTAATGYGLEGYYTEQNGAGTKVINGDGTFIASVEGYTDADKKWIHVGGETLYAYYMKAEISLAMDKSTAAPWSDAHPDSITVTPTIYPTPVGSPRICWTILQNNDNPVAEQPTFRNLSGSRVRFATKYASGNYKVAAVLRIGGSNCEDGTVLDADTVNFIIAGNHTVTIQYKYGSNVIRTASSETVGALDSVAITAPEITGYTFSYWTFGEGVFSNKIPEGKDTVQNVNPIKVVATYDATLTANYTKKNMIYFNNTLGWSDVYVYFYSSDKYWVNDFIEGQGCGTGSDQSYEVGGSAAYYRGYHGHMTNIEGTNIWYYDYEAEWGADSGGEIKGYDDVVFVETEQNNYKFFYANKACRRGDFKHSLPMFVPLTTKTNTKNETDYYSNGYWMNYPESTGYTLKIYSGTDKSKSDEIYSIPFEFTEDMTMPMELTVELNAATTYGFEIYRNDGNYYGNNATMQSGSSGDDEQTIWQFETSRSRRAGLLTSAAGDYTFKLSYGLDQQATPAYNYLVGVHYPAGLNDYRIVYNDLVAWSQSTSHDASWYHPSRTIHKENGATDIVSFYVSKAAGASASMKFQYVSAINAGTGAVTWTDSIGGGISAVDTISKSGVYNFHLSQANGTITVSKVEPYNGNYYIRTDYAGTTGWDFYRASDHKMTYTEFSKNRSTNTFGDLFSHYYAHWCERHKNIKFVIANDYSSCISDTLGQDQYPSVNYFNNLTDGGELYYEQDGGKQKYDDANAYQDKYSANIRFMYNESTNKISRAYVSSSTHVTRRFLVLAGTSDLKDANGNDIPATANLEANAVLFNDNQNFMYEVTVKAIPGARVKLYAKYNDIDQYFRGVAGEFTDANTIELIGGGGGTPQKVKVVYDFKTNRLVTAWEPDGTDIEETLAINADVMINRDHQGSGEAITFGTNGKLDEVKTVYGTMTFNRWILNNRANPEDMTPESCADAAAIAANHPVLPVADQKSIYDRSLYFLSFPFDVKLSEVFGFGHYWDEWYIEYYDGLTRARNGFWADSDPNWKYVMPEDVNDFVLRANEGYILGLDLDYMKADNFNFWTNKSSQVVLYFPSTANIESITSTEAVIPALGEEYKCTINRGTTEGDRRVKDSYWRCIGVPGYSSYNQTLTTDDDKTITWQTSTEWHADLEDYPFLYEWNSTDNTLTPQATSNYTFKSMHAYLVQNQRAIHWSAISATPVSPIVARQNTGTAINYNWCLTLERNGVLEDKTHIRMTNSETVTDGFDFGPDMSKEFNAKRSDIYTLIGYERAAANSMPIHENQTTIIPVGVSIETTGEYTFAMPEGTHGVGVKLNDTETGTQTNLSAGLSYTLTLNKGDYTNRFFIEISPVQGATTGMENSDVSSQNSDVRKMIIDQKLFIIKGDKMYDARGAMVK